MVEHPIAQQKNLSKKYWNLGGWEKLTADERQHILDDRKTYNFIWKNTGKNEGKVTPTKDEMNFKIKHPQANLDANNKRLAPIPDINDSNNNSVDPSKSIKGRKAMKKNSKMNDSQGEAA